MTKPRVSLLGGGWLGAPLAQALLQAGYRVQLSTASEARQRALAETFGDAAPVHRVHVTPRAVTGGYGPLLEAEVLILNIPPLKGQPTEEQFAALLPLVEASAVERVLLVSSTGVYHPAEAVITEDSGAENHEHKLYRSEQVWQNATVDTTVLRLAGLIGGRRHPGRFFQRRGVIPQPEAPVNLIHRDDAVAMVGAILAQEAWGEVYNGCADAHPEKGVFYPKAAAALGLPAPALGERGAGPYKEVSNARIKKALGLTLQHPDLLALLDHWR